MLPNSDTHLYHSMNIYTKYIITRKLSVFILSMQNYMAVPLKKLHETFLPPSPTLTEAGVSRVNPTFLSWTKQDQLLLGWLRSTTSSSILSQYISRKTAAHLWSSLHRVYSAVSAARGSSCSDYYTHLLSIADQLAASGSPVPDLDLVNYILTGLGPEFNSFVVTLTTRATPVSLTELHGFLLAYENLLSTQSQTPAAFSSDLTALYSAQTNRGEKQV